MKKMLSLEIEENLYKDLEKLKKMTGASKTYHLTQALTNYLNSKKVTLNEKSKN